MTFDIGLTLAILVLAILLFVTERLGVDVVALLVLGSLAATGLVTPAEAVSGFSNPAVITVWAVLILSGGLSRTGVANFIGRHVLRLAGQGEVRLMAVIMLAAGVMSAFMNDIGVTALLLPVVISIARTTGQTPSLLLIPLAFGSLLGGLNTLIGTPPNILISDALRQYDLQPFQMFDYTPVGLPLMLAGVAFMTLAGRHLLPKRDIAREFSNGLGQPALREVFGLQERLFILQLPGQSPLSGKSLKESRLGSVLGVNVISIIRQGQTHLAPRPETRLQPGDQLVVSGRIDQVMEVRDTKPLLIEQQRLDVERLVSTEVDIAEIGLSPHSTLIGHTLQQVEFRRRYGAVVLAIWRHDTPIRTDLDNLPLKASDRLLVHATRDRLQSMQDNPDLVVSGREHASFYQLQERLMVVSIPPDSTLAGKSLATSRIAEVFGLTVLGIIRDGSTYLVPEGDEQFQPNDKLLVKGKTEGLETLQALQDLEIDRQTSSGFQDMESERVGLVEAVLSPHSKLAGQTLRQLHFREKYGLSVLAIWREGRAYRSNLRDIALRFGDALLLHGPWDRFEVLSREPDFLVLAEEIQEPPRQSKAPLALLLMAGVLLTVILDWLPISIAAVIGATLMVVTGCLNIEEAYRFIEWKAIFLIAGMLPLGIAMEQTGTARLLAERMVAVIGSMGPLAAVAGFYLLTTLATQVMPNPAVAVLLAPIAINSAADLGMSPHALMMTVALAASAAFLSPVAHPVNVLVMGPGGYRFVDYLRVGLPLSLVLLVVLLLTLPIFWPLLQ